MNFFEFIKKLQKKPEDFRKRIAFITVFVITGIIFLIWLTALNFRFEAKEEGVKKIEGPFKAIKEDIVNFYETVRGNIKDIK